MSNDLVVVKLVNGELFMAAVIGDTPDSLIVQDPVAVRQVQVAAQGGVIERTVTNPFCSITDAREYSFDRRNILFIQPLSEKVAKYYNQLIREITSDEYVNDEQTVFDSHEDEEEQDIEPTLVIPDKHSIH